MARTLRILFIGDLVGMAGLETLTKYLPGLIDEYSSDLVVVNGENIVNGKGLSEREADVIFGLGAHVITTGNHVWENWKARPLLSKNPKVLRPLNYPPNNPGNGFVVAELADGRKAAVLHLQGRVFMQPIDCPFRAAEKVLTRLQAETNIIFVDMHAEATAEKMALANFLDGKISALVGTHTHVQTADARILPRGTAYVTDAGMTGPYDSVLGMRTDIALRRFLLQTPHKYESATEDLRICGVHVEVDEISGAAVEVETIMRPAMPRTRRSEQK